MGYNLNMKKVDGKLVLKYDTPVCVLEKKQGVSFGVPPTTKLGDYIKKLGYPSLAEMMK